MLSIHPPIINEDDKQWSIHGQTGDDDDDDDDEKQYNPDVGVCLCVCMWQQKMITLNDKWVIHFCIVHSIKHTNDQTFLSRLIFDFNLMQNENVKYKS